MVHIPLLNSRVMSSITGSSLPLASFCILMCLKSSLSKPNFFANIAMIVWSGSDLNSDSTTFSRYCIERLEAVTEPYVSNWVEAGSRYRPSFFSLITADIVGYGSITTSMSSFSIAFGHLWQTCL